MPKKSFFKVTFVQIAPVEAEVDLVGLEQVSVRDHSGRRFKSFAWFYVIFSIYIYYLCIRLLFRGQ